MKDLEKMAVPIDLDKISQKIVDLAIVMANRSSEWPSALYW